MPEQALFEKPSTQLKTTVTQSADHLPVDQLPEIADTIVNPVYPEHVAQKENERVARREQAALFIAARYRVERKLEEFDRKSAQQNKR